MSQKSFQVGFVLFSLSLMAGTALAGGFSIREQSAEGQGASFAGVAAGTHGLSSMFWNPATISQHNANGYMSESDLSLILPYSRAKDGVGGGGSGDSGNIGVTALVPASYSTNGLTDEITLGMAITSQFGLATDANVWTGSWHGNESEIFSINVNPNVAYKPMAGITIGLGLQGQFMQGKFSSQSSAGGPNFLDVKADDIGVGFTAGLLFEPTDNLDIGIGFRSAVKHKLKGDGDFLRARYFDRRVSARITTPEMITVGVRYEATEQLALLGGFEWTNWSRVKELTISLDEIGVPLTTPEDWKDSYFFSLGGEYAVSDQLLLRGGVAFEKSPVPDSTRTPRLPDNDRYWVSVGAGYKVNDWLTANLAYSHVFIKDGDIALAAGALPPLNANFKQSLNIISASAVIDW